MDEKPAGSGFHSHRLLRRVFQVKSGKMLRPQRGWDLRTGPRSKSGPRVLAQNREDGHSLSAHIRTRALLPSPPLPIRRQDSPGGHVVDVHCWGEARVRGYIADRGLSPVTGKQLGACESWAAAQG